MQNVLNFKRREIKIQIRQIARNVKMCFRSKLFSVAVQVAAIIILPLVDRSPCVDERVESRSPASTPSKSHYSCLSGWHVEAATSLQLSNAFAALQRFAFNEVTIYSRTISSSPFRAIFSRNPRWRLQMELE